MMHKLTEKQTHFGAKSASICNRSSETESILNAAAQKPSSYEYNHASHESNNDTESKLVLRQKEKDDEDVVIGQLSNGCDIRFKKVSIDQILSSKLKGIKMDLLAQDNLDAIELNAEATKTPNALNLEPSDSTVITNAGHCTTTSKNSGVFTTESAGQCDTSSSRGKDDITNNKSELVNIVSRALPTDQNAFSLACPTHTFTIPLHVCDASNNHPHNNSANHTKYHMFSSELTHASSSQLLAKIDQSSHCNNCASLSQSKRQSSFLKSQSLDIDQGLPLFKYFENDELVFFQLPEMYQQQLKKHVELSDDMDTQHDGENTSKEQETTRSSVSGESSTNTQKTGLALKTQSLDSRPIYPHVPYSPYASPRSNRRRPPLRESRRISIEQSGSFLQLNQYKLMDQIGQGSYGLVKLAYSEEDSTHYAMKILSKRRLLRQAGLMKRGPKKSTSPLDRVYREIAVLKKLDHPNVVKLIEVLDDPIEDSLYMVFELVKQGEVLSIPTKTPLSEERAWSVFRDTLLGLEYLHYQKIIHADIKPGNLLLTECGRVKIADLGVCNEFIGEDSTMTNGSTAGTPAFRPPETLNVGKNFYCGKAADIWAMGVTLYALVYGNVPFQETSVPVLYDSIKNCPLRFPGNTQTCSELVDCIQCMLVKDPTCRITLPALKVHPWVTSFGLHPLPSEEENCRLVQVNDDDINSVVRSIPKLDTLILIKTMLKKHSFGNPFLRGGISGRAPQRGGSRLERFVRAGRSNSAPGAYLSSDRHLSEENLLPALSEHIPSNCTNDIIK